MHWVTTPTGHQIAISDGAIIARNAKGKDLASVPPKVKKSEEFEDLDRTLSFLHSHDIEVGQRVETWVQRGLPVPRALLTEVWADEAWRSWLTDLVVATDDGVAGFLRAADTDGLGIVDLDGESVALTAEQVVFPHPAVIEELDDMRELASELGIEQRLEQLFREVHRQPTPPHDAKVMNLTDWSGAEFDELRFAMARAVAAGAKSSGGYATLTTYEQGHRIVVRFWIGEGYPDEATATEELAWADAEGQTIPVHQVPPVAYSEGVRLATHIHAGRKVEEPNSDR